MPRLRLDPPRSEDEAPEVEVVIEVPRGSFLKRGATGRVDFVSPLPCPFNYGSVPNFLGLEGDLLDALVLGPRLPFGTRLRVRTWGAVTLTDRGMSDDKLIGDRPRRTLARAVAGATDPLLIEQRLLIGDGSLHHGDPPRFTFVVCLLNDPKARLGKPAMDALLLWVAKR